MGEAHGELQAFFTLALDRGDGLNTRSTLPIEKRPLVLNGEVAGFHPKPVRTEW
jgi:hypothetical protein